MDIKDVGVGCAYAIVGVYIYTKVKEIIEEKKHLNEMREVFNEYEDWIKEKDIKFEQDMKRLDEIEVEINKTLDDTDNSIERTKKIQELTNEMLSYLDR